MARVRIRGVDPGPVAAELQKRTPVPAVRGVRNLWCRWYARCLTDAVAGDWPGWTCGKCNLRHKVDKSDPDDPASIVGLCWAVLHPVRWGRFLEWAERHLRRERDPL